MESGKLKARKAKMPSEDDQRVARIASLGLANAMIFQEVLSTTDARVSGLKKLLQRPDFASALSNEWKMIIDDIDYIPIFKIGYEILINTSSTATFDDSLRKMAEMALRITSRRAALRHDLMGRIYHLLLSDAKYFGAFYTMVPSATLLLSLTFSSDDWSIDWSDLDAIRSLRIADLACGTGTLLKASMESVIDNYVVSCAANGVPVKLRELHKILIEDVLIGLDVLPFAIHLAATTLALHSPEVPFRLMQLYNLPLGAPSPTSAKLGSIDLFRKGRVTVQSDLFGGIQGPERVAGSGDVSENLAIGKLDLCVMNPPFTRSVGGNLLFGSAPKQERERMQKELQRLLKEYDVQANITAGLGSVFVALGDRFLKRGGRLALVLPRSILSGVAWAETRDLLESGYAVEYVITVHEPGRWNFSENTKLGEALVVAKRRTDSKKVKPTIFVNLWRRPRNNVEALTCSNLVISAEPANLETNSGVSALVNGPLKFGETLKASISNWSRACAFAQTDLNRAACFLAKGQLRLPGKNVGVRIPLTKLGDISDVGPDRRDIGDGFESTDHFTAYPALMGHDPGTMQTLEVKTNKFLSPLSRARPGRHLRKLEDLWPKASRLMVTERIRLNTYKVVATLVDKPALSNVWWPVKVRDEKHGDQFAKALALWLNSTLGLLLLLAYRGDTEGAWVQIKKPVLESLPVLDVRKLAPSKLRKLSDAFDSIKSQPLLTISRNSEDNSRGEIDEVVSETLGLPEINALRELLAKEPIVSLKSL